MPADDLNVALVIRGQDRSGPAVRSARRGLASISDGLGRIQRAAQGALLVGGVFETLRRGVGGAVGRGLSPRRRGNPKSPITTTMQMGPIPAQAGEPLPAGQQPRIPRAYPRAGGGTTVTERVYIACPGLSPRRRGNLPVRSDCVRGSGPIPAQAGEPNSGPASPTIYGAYPRAGGGTR